MLVFRFALNYALRRAGENNVAGLKGDDAGNVADHLARVKDEVARVRGLARLAVHAALEFEVVGIDLVGGHHVGTDGPELIGRFADHPLPAGFKLKIASGEVVAGRVARYIGQRVCFVYHFGFASH